MDFFTLFAVALGLSFDTFAVSLSCGIIKARIRFVEAVRIALVMALFQGGLPVAGYFIGSSVSVYVKAIDHWVALLLLAFLGGRMIYDGLRKGDQAEARDITRFSVLLSMALGTSIDAFAVGISFGFLDMVIWTSALLIGAVTFIASMAAIRIGKSAGSRLGQGIEIAGGVILVGIGLKIFIEHSFF
ncbi:MAG: manganese efflux pump MntP family protein [Bacteroidales bacterium]